MNRLIAGAIMLTAVIFPNDVLPQSICNTHEIVTKHLEEKYKEAEVSSGFDGAGNYVQVFTSKTGTWTMIISKPGGPTCVMSAGTNWQITAAPKEEKGA